MESLLNRVSSQQHAPASAWPNSMLSLLRKQELSGKKRKENEASMTGEMAGIIT
jgi:hypothetical protein